MDHNNAMTPARLNAALADAKREIDTLLDAQQMFATTLTAALAGILGREELAKHLRVQLALSQNPTSKAEEHHDKLLRAAYRAVQPKG